MDKQKNLKAKPQKWTRRGFVNASEDDIKKYANPDNYNTGTDKYQFLDLSSSSGVSETDMASFLKGKGVLEGQEKTYLDAAKKYNVSEVYLPHILLSKQVTERVNWRKVSRSMV